MELKDKRVNPVNQVMQVTKDFVVNMVRGVNQVNLETEAQMEYEVYRVHQVLQVLMELPVGLVLWVVLVSKVDQVSPDHVVHEVIQVMLVLTEIADLMVGCCTELKDAFLEHPPSLNIILP